MLAKEVYFKIKATTAMSKVMIAFAGLVSQRVTALV